MTADYTFPFHRTQRERFRTGALVREWRDRYPQIFDEDDERVLATLHQRRYHFFEWLSAVLLFESTGYLSVVEKYTAAGHPQKHKKLDAVLPPLVAAWLRANEAGQPDLFVFNAVSGDWFFCEVKGPGDRMRPNQRQWCDGLREVLGRAGLTTEGRFRVLSLQEVDA